MRAMCLASTWKTGSVLRSVYIFLSRRSVCTLDAILCRLEFPRSGIHRRARRADGSLRLRDSSELQPQQRRRPMTPPEVHLALTREAAQVLGQVLALAAAGKLKSWSLGPSSVAYDLEDLRGYREEQEGWHAAAGFLGTVGRTCPFATPITPMPLGESPTKVVPRVRHNGQTAMQPNYGKAVHAKNRPVRTQRTGTRSPM